MSARPAVAIDSVKINGQEVNPSGIIHIGPESGPAYCGAYTRGEVLGEVGEGNDFERAECVVCVEIVRRCSEREAQ